MAKLTFSGGRNTQGNSSSINPEECTDGENFDLSVGLTEFRPRQAFAIAGTAPNGSEIRGFAQLEKVDGTLSTLIQAGNTVYEWNGASTFTSRGTVNANARLRGTRSSNWSLTDKVLITDIEKLEPVSEWDGTTFQAMTTNLVGAFYAKYCLVVNDRAMFANCKNASTDLPNIIVGSQIEDNEVLSVTQKPSSAISAADPFYIISPDLKPINGFVEAFGLTLISTKIGSVWKIAGTSAQDFSLQGLYKGSSADGDEAFVDVGNDVVIARNGAIDMLSSTDRFGDVSTDDISNPILPDVENVTEWRVVYDQERQKIYCFPNGQSLVHVLFKALVPRYQSEGISPWSKYTTKHPSAFQPTTVFSIKNPQTGIYTTYFGDENGVIYALDQGLEADPNGNTVEAFRESQLFMLRDFTGPEGWVQYQKKVTSYDITLTFQWQGEATFDDVSVITVPAIDTGSYYGGTTYYGGTGYYGSSFQSRYNRQEWQAAGVGNSFQIRLDVSAADGFAVDSVELEADEIKA